MLAIVGKASPNPLTGDIEFYMREFEDRLARTGGFAYAWTFNPDAAAIDAISFALASGESVFLYLPRESGMSDVRMRVAGFRHDPSPAGFRCPATWEANCIDDLKGRRAFGSKSRQAIHLWFLIDRIERLSADVNLREAFVPAFESKYFKWGQSYFAFLRPRVVVWREVADLDYREVGHGLLFFSKEPGTNVDLIAVLRGYEWLHERPLEVEVEIRPSDDSCDAGFLESARTDIEALVLNPDSLPGLRTWLSPRVYIHANA